MTKQKSEEERARELDTAVDEIVRVRDRLVAKGYSKEDAIELARNILPRGICSTGNQCAVST